MNKVKTFLAIGLYGFRLRAWLQASMSSSTRTFSAARATMLSASAIRRDPPRLPQAGSRGTASAVAGVAPSSFVDSLDDLYMYCYDLYEQVHAGQEADYTINVDGPTARTLDFLGAVNTSSTVAATSWSDPFAWLTSGQCRAGRCDSARHLGKQIR